VNVIDELVPPATSQTDSSRPSQRKYELVSIASVEEDMRAVREWAGLPPPSGQMPHRFHHYAGMNKTHMSARARELLRAQLAPEYEMLERLQSYARAVPVQPFTVEDQHMDMHG